MNSPPELISNLSLLCPNPNNSSNVTTDPGSQALSILGTVLTALLSLLIIAGNGLIMIAITVVKKLRQPGNYLIVSLALSDFLVGFMVLPLTIVYDVGKEWVFGYVMCDVHVSFDVICCTASIMNLCMISIDRYLIITRPFLYPKQRTCGMMVGYIVAAWVSATLIIIPALFGFTENVKDAPGWIELSSDAMINYGEMENGSLLVNHPTSREISKVISTHWDPGSGSENWYLTLDLHQAYKVQKVRLQSPEKLVENVSFFSVQADLCNTNFPKQMNTMFPIDNQTLNNTSDFDVTEAVAARLIRLTISSTRPIKTPLFLQLSVYGEKLTGKTCLISQEVWFTIYSTVGAFYLPLFVMLFMYWRIYVEAVKFNTRHKRRSTSYPGSQDGRSHSLSSFSTHPFPPSQNRSRCSSSCSEQRNHIPLQNMSHDVSCKDLKFEYDETKLEEKLLQNNDSHQQEINQNYLNKQEKFIPNDKTCSDQSQSPTSQEDITLQKSSNGTSNHAIQANGNLQSSILIEPKIKQNMTSHDQLYKTKSVSKNPTNNPEAKTRFPPITEDGLLELEEERAATAPEENFRNFYGKNTKIVYTRSNSVAGEMCENGIKKDSNLGPSLSHQPLGKKRVLRRSQSNPGRTSDILLKNDNHNGEVPGSESSMFSPLCQHEDSSIVEVQHKRPSQRLSLRSRTSSLTSLGERLGNIKATKTLGVIVGVFTFCWLPFFIVTFIRPFVCDKPESQDCIPLELVRAVLWLGYVNSALNPIIYIGYSPDLKDTFRYLLRCKCSHVDREIARCDYKKAAINEKRASVKSNPSSCHGLVLG